MKQSTLLAALGLTALVGACGQESAKSPATSSPKVIIGENDLQYYTADDELSRSIGKMALGCTVTHIGEGYAITAGHCLNSSYSCSGSSYDVTWGYTDNNRQGNLTSSCEEVVSREFNSTNDYAILRYSPAPSASLPLNTADRPGSGDRLTILSHPNGVPLAWSGWCQHDGNYGGNKFAYQCDTMGGSSGAAVLNEDLEIVGVHNLGSSGYQINAGTYVADIPGL
jgi:V8-like Glu-specific endopeptidase